MGRTWRNTIDQDLHASHQAVKSLGFTLLEVMLAIAILSLVSLGLYQASSQIMTAQQSVESRDEALHALHFTFQKMAQDLGSAYILKGRDFVGSDFQADISFVGGEDRIDFVSFSNIRYIADSRESDSNEVSYYLAKDPENPEQFDLMRRQSTIIDENLKEGGSVYPLFEGVKRLRFEYLPDSSNKEEEWRRQWDSLSVDNNNKLPRLVKVELEIQLPGDEESKTFSSILPIRIVDPIIF